MEKLSVNSCMRILYLTESMKWSGGAHQLLLMAAALKRKGHQITVGCQEGSDVARRAEETGLPVERLRLRQDYDALAAYRVSRLVRRDGIEVLHAQHPTAHAIGLMAAAMSRVPVFAVTRRVIFPMRKNLFSRLKYLSKRIDGYVAVAGAVRDELVKAGVRPERIAVIPSVTEGRAASPEEGARLRRELGLTKGPIIGTVANYADFKGQDFLVEAMPTVLAKHPEARLILAGRDTEQLRPMVARLGLEDKVLLAGFRTDVPVILAALDLFVLPSLKEAAATALREAMAAGVPCIGTRVGGIPELIVDGETGYLVPAADSAALADAIVRVLDTPEAARRMGMAAQSRHRSAFSVEAACNAMESFYERLLETSRKRAA
jgi:L-malate glycosyltransferase